MPYIIKPNIGNVDRAYEIREPGSSNMNKFIKEKEEFMKEKEEMQEENKALKKEIELLSSKLEALNKTNAKASNKKNEKVGE